MGRINITAIRRRQIVNAAIAVMASKGWNETSIDEITKEADVSRGLVSYHFKDKADLLSGVLARCQEVFNGAVAGAMARSSDPVERMRAMIRSALDQIRDDPVNYEVFLHFTAGARSDPNLGEQIRTLWTGYRAQAAAAIRAGQRRGAFRTDIEADAMAATEIGAITGLALQWLLDPGSFLYDEAATQMEEMLMSYLTEGAPSTAPRKETADPVRA
jgi:AcrR family transcriptional regulator